MTTTSQSSLIECAVSAAKTAGKYALANFSRRREVVKSFKHDVKLKLDQECQVKAISVIRKRFPQHSILGEEDDHDAYTGSAANGYQWIVDPIDGTVNFSHGLPVWCCSVGVWKDGEAVAGVVYAPALGELYTATSDQPAMCNNRQIKVSSVNKLADSIIMTGIDKEFDSKLKPLAIFTKLSFNTQKVRVIGSAAWDLCQVARGFCDGYFESAIYLWDIAAAGLIVEKAGGRTRMIKQPDLRHRLSYVATNGRIHNQLINLLTRQ